MDHPLPVQWMIVKMPRLRFPDGKQGAAFFCLAEAVRFEPLSEPKSASTHGARRQLKGKLVAHLRS